MFERLNIGISESTMSTEEVPANIEQHSDTLKESANLRESLSLKLQ